METSSNSHTSPRSAIVIGGGIAGLTVAGLIARNLTDDDPVLPPGATKTARKPWKPPFMLSVAPDGQGGGMLSAFGSW